MQFDANDLHRAQGTDALRERFDEAATSTNAPERIRATPYKWVEPHLIPKREWLMGRYLCRGIVSVTVSPGGVGKSALALCEAVSLASGRDLLDQGLPDEPVRVWYWNLEDSRDELTRRIQAICRHHGLGQEDIAGRLFIDSGIDQRLETTIVKGKDFAIDEDLFRNIEQAVRKNRIDVVIIDPFVSSHGDNENDNGQMDRVAKAWAGLAVRANIAVAIIHHTRKTSGDGQINTESARGAKSLTDAARVVRVLEPMSGDQAASYGLEGPAGYFSARLDKQNFGVPQAQDDWFRIVSEPLGNGDQVGVVARFEALVSNTPPEPDILRAVQARCAEETWGKNIQAGDWIGKLIGEIGGFAAGDDKGKARAKRLMKCWLGQGYLVVEDAYDIKKSRNRPVIRPGKHSPDDSLPLLVLAPDVTSDFECPD
jgi:hypothetical protein